MGREHTVNRGEDRRQYVACSICKLQSKKGCEENNNIGGSHSCSLAEWKRERERES